MLVPHYRCRVLLASYWKDGLSDEAVDEMETIVQQEVPFLLPLLRFARAMEPEVPRGQCPPKLRPFLEAVARNSPAVGCEFGTWGGGRFVGRSVSHIVFFTHALQRT